MPILDDRICAPAGTCDRKDFPNPPCRAGDQNSLPVQGLAHLKEILSSSSFALQCVVYWTVIVAFLTSVFGSDNILLLSLKILSRFCVLQQPFLRKGKV